MQLIDSKTKTIQSGLTGTRTFSMKMNAKAFRVIICDIYSNRIRAFIRELGTNAYEAHQIAKIESRPFEVTLPTIGNPNFVIRDFGPGLSDEEITNIYTVVFESTKTGSNELGGCFGLGSKSPFAYTDNFAVTSIKDGKKNFYTVYLNNDGIPELSLLHSEDTTEPSGLEVKIGIKNGDFNSVKEEVKNVYSSFLTRPIIKNQPNFLFYDNVPILTGPDFSVFSNSQYLSPHVKMGNIVYPIDNNQVKSRLSGMSILIDVPIGSVSPEPSRERLTYTQHTITFLTAKLREVEQAVKARTQQEIDKCQSKYEAQLKALEIISHPFYITDFTYGGVKLDKYIVLSKPVTIGYFGYKNGKFKSYNSDTISVAEENHFFCNDVKTAHKEIIKQNIQALNIKNYDSIIIVNEVDKQKFCSDHGIPEKFIVNISSLPYNKAQRVKTARKTKVLRWKYSGHVTYSWEECQETGGFYVDYHNSYVEFNGREIHPRKIQDILTFLNWKTEVYGIRRIDRKRIANDSNWKKFFIEAETRIKASISNFSPEVIAASTLLLNGIQHKYAFIKQLLNSNELDSMQDFAELKRIYKLAEQATTNNTKAIRAIEDMFGSLATNSLLSLSDVDSFAAKLDNFKNKHPLLNCIESYTVLDTVELNELINYVKKGLK